MSTTPQDLSTQQLVAAITRMAQSIIAAEARDAKNALKLEGKSLAEVIALALQGTSANSSKLEGKTLAEITAAIQAGSKVDIDAVADALATFIARRDNPHAVTAAQVGLGAFADKTIADQAAIDAASIGALVDAAQLKGAIDKFWAEQVGTAPDTLNSIEELAAALQNNPDAIEALQTLVTQNGAAIDALEAKQAADKTELQKAIDDGKAANDQALADALTEAKAYADSLKLTKATQSQAEEGTDDTTYMTPLSVKQAIAVGLAGTAENANKFDGKTYAEVKADILSGKAATAGTADNALKLEGKSLAEVVAQAVAAVDLTPYLQKSAAATDAEAATGTATDRYLTPANLASVLTGYLKVDAQAADSAKFGGKTLAEVMADVKATKVDNAAFADRAGDADKLGGLAAADYTQNVDFLATIAALTEAFNKAADDIDNSGTEEQPAGS